MPKTRRKQKRGGAFIAQGAYGCGFYPSLKCKDQALESDDKFSKLVFEEKIYNDEMKYTALLSPIDVDQQYTLYPEKGCDLNMPSVVPSNSYNSCTLNGSTGPVKKLIISKNGGKAIFDDEHPAKNMKLNSSQYAPFFKGILNLLKGLKVLHDGGVIHMDIKPSNIVAKENEDSSFTLRYIDFGLCFELAKYEESDVYKHRIADTAVYMYWPLYIKASTNINRMITNKYSYKDEFSKRYDKLPCIHMGLSSTYEDDVQTNKTYFQTITLVERRKHIFHASDIFSLGVSIYQLLQHFFGIIYVYNLEYRTGESTYTSFSSTTEIPPMKTYVWDPIYEIINKMVTLNKSDRISIEDAITQYEALLPAIETYVTAEAVNAFASISRMNGLIPTVGSATVVTTPRKSRSKKRSCRSR
jgi:serine/threonine protein kinase